MVIIHEEAHYNIVSKMSLVQTPASLQENLPLDVPVVDNSNEKSDIVEEISAQEKDATNAIDRKLVEELVNKSPEASNEENIEPVKLDVNDVEKLSKSSNGENIESVKIVAEDTDKINQNETVSEENPIPNGEKVDDVVTNDDKILEDETPPIDSKEQPSETTEKESVESIEQNVTENGSNDEDIISTDDQSKTDHEKEIENFVDATEIVKESCEDANSQITTENNESVEAVQLEQPNLDNTFTDCSKESERKENNVDVEMCETKDSNNEITSKTIEDETVSVDKIEDETELSSKDVEENTNEKEETTKEILSEKNEEEQTPKEYADHQNKMSPEKEETAITESKRSPAKEAVQEDDMEVDSEKSVDTPTENVDSAIVCDDKTSNDEKEKPASPEVIMESEDCIEILNDSSTEKTDKSENKDKVNSESAEKLKDDIEVDSEKPQSVNTPTENVESTVICDNKTGSDEKEKPASPEVIMDSEDCIEIFNDSSPEKTDKAENKDKVNSETSENVIDADNKLDTTNSSTKTPENKDITETLEVIDIDSTPETFDATKDEQSNSSISEKKVENDKKSKENKVNNQTARSMLANNMVIFSDEEDEPESKKRIVEPANNEAKQDKDCVTVVDDDDDIMVIDDESTPKNDVTVKTEQAKSNEEKELESNHVASTESSKIEQLSTEKTNDEVKKTEIINTKPIVAADFLKNFKTKMGEMNRSDLEEFCVLKIVEGVIDRSNLSEIKAKLKTMMQNVEEWKKKAMVLNKQNRDLQIVLRTVQEEQKKKSEESITPLKITRSVGMQVLITDPKMDGLRGRPQKRVANFNNLNTNSPNTPKTVQPKQPAKNAKNSIPVPRLVPATSPAKSAPQTSKLLQVQNSTVTSNSGQARTAQQNLNRSNSTSKVAEKRPFSDAIDLTDDEPSPPAKKPPVRLVPSQQLMAPGRSSIVTPPKNSSPRQVYIPIGSQGNNAIRPGQSIVFKNTPNVRPRGPNSVQGIRHNAAGPRTPARPQHKHPAPLPQSFSQPQPPNWKALPPAPELKISKIENGIVVSWKIDGYQESSYEEIVSYQLYAYQETSAPASTVLWNKIGDIKALPLPMACTLTQFIAGYKYYFAVRAVDIRSRIGPFSLPGSILLLNK